MRQIYLDNSATTRVYDEAAAAMDRCLRLEYGNPSSLHRMGIAAESTVRQARRTLADALGAREGEIVFTGSGTEADNAALFGAAYAKRRRGDKILVSAVEHPAVLAACQRLAKDGFRVVEVPVDGKGRIDQDAFAAAVDASTILVSVMAVNNELGTIQPLEELIPIVRKRSDALFHTDAVQAFGKISLDPGRLGLDLVSVSAHKIHGPKGIGALYIRSGVTIEPLLYGGGQEASRRGGTENTPAIAGFAAAVGRQQADRSKRVDHLAALRARLRERLTNDVEGCAINGPYRTFGENSPAAEGPGTAGAGGGVAVPSILNASFPGCRGEVLLHALEQHGIFVSTGAACSSRKKASHVLTAAGLPAERIESALRFSFSEFNTIEEIDFAADRLAEAVQSQRSLGRRTRFG